MKTEFLQPKNYLTINFAQIYPQLNFYFHKIHLLLKLLDPVKQPIPYRIFHKEIPLQFVLMKKIFGTKRALSKNKTTDRDYTMSYMRTEMSWLEIMDI